MSETTMTWGCCALDDSNEDYIQCSTCRKAFHNNCLGMDVSDESSQWNCPICTGKSSKTKKNDSTPVRFNTNSARVNKRQALQSPPELSDAPVTESGIQKILKDAMEQQFDGFLSKFESTMKTLLNRELKTVRNEIKEVREAVDFMSSQYEDILKENSAIKKTVKELEEKNDSMSLTMKEMSARLNTLEQHARSNNAEIQCVPEKKNENLINVITQLGKTVGCVIKEENISHCTRTAKFNSNSNRPKSIIVQFNSQKLRDTFLAASINFNKPKAKADKLNTSHLGLGGTKSPIYITEHLSPANKALHAATRLMAKEKGYKYVWTRGGRIFTRKNDDSEFKLIKDMNSLDNLK